MTGSFWLDSLWAVLLAFVCLIACIWCAAGLRKDDEAGEIADRYISRRNIRLTDFILGDSGSERRRSTGLVVACVAAIGVSVARYLWGH